VYKAVTAIAKNLATVPVEFFVGDTDQLAPPDHIVPSTFKNPEPNVLGSQFIEKAAHRLELTGNWFVLEDEIARPIGGGSPFPHVLKTLQTHRIRPDRDLMQMDLRRWIWWAGGSQTPIPLEQMMHAYYLNPADEHVGLSPLSAAALEVETDWSAAIWNRVFFENFATPSLMFERDVEAPSTPKQDERFEEAWKLRRAGASQSQGAAMLPPGVKPVESKGSHRTMQFPDLRRYSREEILMVFDVPPAIAGVFEFANYANSLAQLRYFWYHKLFPLMRYLESVIQAELLDRFETGLTAKFKIEEIMALIEDFAQKVETAKKLYDLGFTAKDINNKLNLGFEIQFKSQEIPWVPTNLTPAEPLAEQSLEEPVEEPPPDPGSPPPGDGDEDTDGDEDDGGDQDEGEEEVEEESSPPPVVSSAHKTLALKVARETESIERTYAGRLRAFFTGLEKEVMAKVDEIADVERAFEDEILFDFDAADQKLQKISRPVYRNAISSGGKSAVAEAGVAAGFSLSTAPVALFLANKEVLVTGTLRTLKEELREVTTLSTLAGESSGELRSRLQDRFDIERTRASLISGTEVGQAFGKGRFEGMKQAGVEFHQWITLGDAFVRDGINSQGDHVSLEGEIVKVGDPFSNGLQHPLDTNGPPEERIGCRCVAVVITRSEMALRSAA
jgi:HK97 family phage portal protein